jgi:hypothetical protein
MRIIYSPEFNSTSYIDLQKRQGQLLGLKVCGSNELLSLLELRAGIATMELSEPERLMAYHDTIKEIVNKTIFAKSFAMDEIGVTRQLLNWCDNLLMAGWNPKEQRFTKKLENLAKLLDSTHNNFQAIRWNEIYNYIRDNKIFDEGDCLEVHATKEFLPLVIRRTLDELNNQGWVEYVQPTTADTTYRLKVYKFKTRTAAYQWYLSNPEALNDINVTVSSDNCMLNDMAISLNKPVVGSKSVDSNPQVLQLFKLGISLFARPLNVYNLLSYLQVPGHPAKGIAFQLAKVLASEGGINEEWQKTIDEYDFKDKDGNDKRDDCLPFINMVTEDYQKDSIPVEPIKYYANKLAHWCDMLTRSKHVNDERKEQLVVLASFCRSLVQTLKGRKTITSEELLVAVDGIYQPQSFTHFKAEKDSPDFISSITQLADSVNNVCWLGCVGSSLSTYPYDFLNAEEIKKLNEQGLSILSKTEFYTQYRQLQLHALQKICKNLILVCWEYDGNERQEEHPLMTEFKAKYDAEQWAGIMVEDEKPNLKEKDGEVVELDIFPDYQLNGAQLKTLKRETESFSSISTLIQHPFDYTVDYLLKLREPSVGQMDDLNTTKGNVAHLFIENLVKEFGTEMPNKYKNLKDEEKDCRINIAIGQKGAILLLPEYKMELKQFVVKLKESVLVLADIITHLSLQPLDCEVKMNVQLKVIGSFEAKPDMVLQEINNPSNYVIFDFKWSESSSFEKKFKEKRAMQLEFYSQAATLYYKQQDENAKVVGTAYYLFPMCKLFTTVFAESDHIVKVKVDYEADNRELFEEIKNSYIYRRNELNNGKVEDSELCAIADLPYTKDTSGNLPRYPLEGQYKREKDKKCPYVKTDKPAFAKKTSNWGDGNADDCEIKTTHSILKGRLV